MDMGLIGKEQRVPSKHFPDSFIALGKQSLLFVEIKAPWCREVICIRRWIVYKIATLSCPQRSIVSKLGESQLDFPVRWPPNAIGQAPGNAHPRLHAVKFPGVYP